MNTQINCSIIISIISWSLTVTQVWKKIDAHSAVTNWECGTTVKLLLNYTHIHIRQLLKVHKDMYKRWKPSWKGKNAVGQCVNLNHTACNQQKFQGCITYVHQCNFSSFLLMETAGNSNLNYNLWQKLSTSSGGSTYSIGPWGSAPPSLPKLSSCVLVVKYSTLHHYFCGN